MIILPFLIMVPVIKLTLLIIMLMLLMLLTFYETFFSRIQEYLSEEGGKGNMSGQIKNNLVLFIIITKSYFLTINTCLLRCYFSLLSHLILLKFIVIMLTKGFVVLIMIYSPFYQQLLSVIIFQISIKFSCFVSSDRSSYSDSGLLYNDVRKGHFLKF